MARRILLKVLYEDQIVLNNDIIDSLHLNKDVSYTIYH